MIEVYADVVNRALHPITGVLAVILALFDPCRGLYHWIQMIGNLGMMDKLLHGDGGITPSGGLLLLLVDMVGEDTTS